MTNLSPAAQAVMDAVHGQDAEPYPLIVAAALRAAAEYAGQTPAYPINSEWDNGFVDGVRLVCRYLLAIAAELDGGAR